MLILTVVPDKCTLIGIALCQTHDYIGMKKVQTWFISC